MEMKQYKSQKQINVASSTAWHALEMMHIWLPQLRTVTAIEYIFDAPFLIEGNTYTVFTPEGPAMKSKISYINQKEMIVQLEARFLMLKSVLQCSVTPINKSSCIISRTQFYPGITGTIFTLAYNKRESEETNEYLSVWERYALSLL